MAEEEPQPKLLESEDNELEDDEEESSGDSDSSSEPPEIGLDQNGRIVPGVRGPVNYGFQSYHDCVKGIGKQSENENLGHQLFEDCGKVFTARQAADDAAYSAGETYFIGADEVPTTGLERLALDIFEFHAQNLEFDRSKSGAEWWTLVLEEDSDVSMHWDKDYGLEDYCVNVFPNISTVTYLSDVGGPTLVLQKTAPPRPTDDLSGHAGPFGFCSRPVSGKHISFDGRFLHYASKDLLPAFGLSTDDMANHKIPRVTFLVNIWFNHRPRDPEPLSKDIRKMLSVRWDSQKPENRLWTGSTAKVQYPQTFDCKDISKSCSTVYEMGSGNDMDEEYVVTVRIPKTNIDPNEISDSIFIEYSESCAATIVKKTN